MDCKSRLPGPLKDRKGVTETYGLCGEGGGQGLGC